MLSKLFEKLSYTRVIALSFLLVISIGCLFLTLPISSKSGEWTSFVDALFTSTSATCVTGLIVCDTYTHWSVFGQIVILVLIQIGGLGLMTIISMVAIFMKKKINLKERRLLAQSTGSIEISGIVKMVKRIILGTFIIEGTGVVLLAICFIPEMGLAQGLYYAVFHSISAFCNAGFDLMGKYEKFSSLTRYSSNIPVNVIIMLLIIIGGIGFLVWRDIVLYKNKFNMYSLHSKLVLWSTAILLVMGTAGFLIFEYNAELKGMSVIDKVTASAFMSVTTRTAGFNTIDLSKLSGSGRMLTDVLMFIGGSPGSTAGGVKTTTIAVIILSVIAMSKGESEVNAFKKRIEESVIKQASVIVVIYMVMILLASMIICSVEHLDTGAVFIEVVSAAATVGLSTGITSTLCIISKIILIILMYAGRIGGLSLLIVIGENKKNSVLLKRPTEKILIG